MSGRGASMSGKHHHEARTGVGRQGVLHANVATDSTQMTMTIPQTARLLSMKPAEINKLWSDVGDECEVDINIGKSNAGYQVILKGAQKNVIRAKGLITRRTQPQVWL